MEKLVKKIMNIEKQAGEKLEFEKKRMENLDSEVEKIVAQRRIELEEKQQERLSAIAASEGAEEDERIRALNDSFEKQKAELTREFQDERERLVNEIFERIIS